ncbi:MAG: DUF1257 domain-containing protein [Armatimonadetes bacterium]|nr:DUF1257 domain-containing protein [Armatimonadota bacterium]
MSHITVLKTEIRELSTVEAALRRLGYPSERDTTIPDYYGHQVHVDLAVHLPGQRAVGFNCNPTTGLLELTGDWWGGTIRPEELMSDLTRNYAREQVLDSLEAQGVDLSRVKETELDDGTVIFELPLEEDQMEALLA